MQLLISAPCQICLLHRTYFEDFPSTELLLTYMPLTSNHYQMTPHSRPMDPSAFQKQKISLPSIPSIPSFRAYPTDQPRIVPEHHQRDRESPSGFFRPLPQPMVTPPPSDVSPRSSLPGSLSLPPLPSMGPPPPSFQVPMARHHSDLNGYPMPPLPPPTADGRFFPGPTNANGPVPGLAPTFPNVVVLNQPEDARAFHEFQMMRAANQSMGRNPYQEQPADMRRKRQVRRRTRTGCLTCRKRRIKCDERKPACFNCEKSRKQCAGYEETSKRYKRGSSSEEEHSEGDEQHHDSKRKISFLMN